MLKKPNVCVLRTAGVNCDKETAFAFTAAGARADLVHVNRLIDQKASLKDYQILVLPGGFSYGDDLGAGKILANELRFKLISQIKEFIQEGKLIIGICNGFQILVKSGLLPGNDRQEQQASLILNDSAKFEDRWVYLRSSGKCVWTKGLPEVIYLPVAHGEGKFICENKAVLAKLKKNDQIVFQYCDMNGDSAGYPFNPNGAQEDIAGICDDTGRIMGLMPHPERHVGILQHPRHQKKAGSRQGDGSLIFRNGVEYVKKNL